MFCLPYPGSSADVEKNITHRFSLKTHIQGKWRSGAFTILGSNTIVTRQFWLGPIEAAFSYHAASPDFFPSRSEVTSNTHPLPNEIATPWRWSFSLRESQVVTNTVGWHCERFKQIISTSLFSKPRTKAWCQRKKLFGLLVLEVPVCDQLAPCFRAYG